MVAVLLVSFFGAPLIFLSAQVTTQDVSSRRAELEEELAELESEIAVQRGFLQEKQRETGSLERDITILNTEIRSAELSIQARNLSITKLQGGINQKVATVNSLSEKLAREKESLAQLIRKTREIDAYSIIEIILGNKGLSDFFEDVNTFDSIKLALQESFNKIASTKRTTNKEKESLLDDRKEEEDLRYIQRIQKRRIEEDKTEKNEILDITKGEENVYQQIVTSKERDAAVIRNAIFLLRGSAAIPFGEALNLATKAFRQTGVRPALILGVIQQESNLGENVGQCLLTNIPNKGDGKGKNTGRLFDGVMKASRDVDIFMHLAEQLGFSYSAQPVSCPPSYGDGGAMGPAQFIPSTWVLFEANITKLTGNSPPNPWDPEDAFMASALLLKDNGAAKGTYAAERLAALRYFAGWRNARKSAYAFYGDDVMRLTAKHQSNIDFLQGN